MPRAVVVAMTPAASLKHAAVRRGARELGVFHQAFVPRF
jgi:hypothetical protein